jgi:hypothetical protein
LANQVGTEEVLCEYFNAAPSDIDFFVGTFAEGKNTYNEEELVEPGGPPVDAI